MIGEVEGLTQGIRAVGFELEPPDALANDTVASVAPGLALASGPRHHYRGTPLYRADTLHLSTHGLVFLVREEGLRLRPYTDSLGWATTGIGHLIQPQHKGVTSHDLAHYSFRNQAAAFAFFRRNDEPVYAGALHSALGHSLVTRAQWDMCFSLCFNIGTGGFRSSTVARMIRAGNYGAAANAFYSWSNPSVLRPRRGREAHRFTIGHY